MKGLWRIVGAVVAVGFTACEPIDIDDGSGGGGGGNVQFSRGFAFVRDRNVYVVDDRGDPNSPQRLTTTGGAFYPTVSRNGRSVAFVYQAGSTFELRTVPTGSSAQPSTVFASGDAACSRCTNFRYPAFSPDGNVIVFAFNRGGSGLFSLGRVNANGSGFQELTPNTTISYGAPSFFPDGQSVLAPAGGTQLSQLAQVRLSGGVTFITNSLGNEILGVVNRAAVSPDGTQVALDGRLSSGDTRIFVARLSPFGPLTRLTNPREGQDSFPSWMSASQVAYLSGLGSDQNVYSISISSTTGSGDFKVPSALEPSYGGT